RLSHERPGRVQRLPEIARGGSAAAARERDRAAGVRPAGGHDRGNRTAVQRSDDMTDSDRTPGAPGAPEPAAAEAPGAQALVLAPPAPVPAVSRDQAAASMQVDDATAKHIDSAVGSFVESL